MSSLPALLLLLALPSAALAQSNGSAEEPADRFRTAQEQVEHDQPTQEPMSRKTLAAFAECVADRDVAKAKALLVRDFREKSYRDALERFIRANGDCMDRTSHRSIGSTRLPFSAALAEHLLKREATPLNVRLAKAASGTTTETFGPSDAAAMCVARSAPDQVGLLLATEVDSEAEIAAAKSLSPVLDACAQAVGSPPISSTPFGLRSVIASAAFRLLEAQTPPPDS